MASSLLEQLLGNAATNSSLLATVEARLEYIGLYLIAKAEGGREPKLAPARVYIKFRSAQVILFSI